VSAKKRRIGLEPIPPVTFEPDDEAGGELVVESPAGDQMVDRRGRRGPKEQETETASSSRRRVMTITLPDESYRDKIETIAAQMSEVERETVAPSTMAMRLLLAALDAWEAGVLTIEEEVTELVTHKLKWQGIEDHRSR
jgi:hypothetical protein